MKRFALSSIPFLFLSSLFLLASCITEDEYADNPSGNVEALWTIMDEHYCFFDAKGVDWDSVHAVFSRQADEDMNDVQLFEVMTNMLSTLRDGHVNLYAPFDVGRNWTWKENYPTNFSDTLARRYLGTDYRIASGLQYRILDDNVGYVRCASFENAFGEGNLNEVMEYLAPCNAMILDVRGNPGGLLTSAQQLAARFTNETIHVGYMQHKTGKGHHDFSGMEKQWLKPSKRVRWQKRVVVLTNRGVFSAANEFVKYMKQCPQVTIVGDRTGGGAGLPFSSELPNGWSVRFSACPMYDVNMHTTEDGINPDYNVSMTDDDFVRGIDTILEFARNLAH